MTIATKSVSVPTLERERFGEQIIGYILIAILLPTWADVVSFSLFSNQHSSLAHSRQTGFSIPASLALLPSPAC